VPVPTPLNLTGTWVVAGQPGGLAISHVGTTIGCTVLGSAVQVSCGGTINGSNVTLNFVTQVVSPPITVVATTAMSLIATNSTMTGTQKSSATCKSSDPEIPCPAVPDNNGAVTFTKQ
jgi:hypothetical protein